MPTTMNTVSLTLISTRFSTVQSRTLSSLLLPLDAQYVEEEESIQAQEGRRENGLDKTNEFLYIISPLGILSGSVRHFYWQGEVTMIISEG
jgi:hypothetical protein